MASSRLSPPEGMLAIFSGISNGVIVPSTPFARIESAMFLNVCLRFAISVSLRQCLSNLLVYICLCRCICYAIASQCCWLVLNARPLDPCCLRCAKCWYSINACILVVWQHVLLCCQICLLGVVCSYLNAIAVHCRHTCAICVSGESWNHRKRLDFCLRYIWRQLIVYCRADFSKRCDSCLLVVFIWLVDVYCLCERRAAEQYSAVVASFKHYGLHSAFRVWTKADACSMYCPHSVFVNYDLLSVSNLKLLCAKRIEVYAVLDSKLAVFHISLLSWCVWACPDNSISCCERLCILSFFSRRPCFLWICIWVVCIAEHASRHFSHMPCIVNIPFFVCPLSVCSRSWRESVYISVSVNPLLAIFRLNVLRISSRRQSAWDCFVRLLLCVVVW